MKKSWKMFLPLVICLALCMSLFTVSASAAAPSTQGTVEQDGDKWVATDKDGKVIQNGWVAETSKDPNSGKVTKTWYYAVKGELVDGWHNIDGDWYYFEPYGEPSMRSNNEVYMGDGQYDSSESFQNAKDSFWVDADGALHTDNSGWVSRIELMRDREGNKVPRRVFYFANSDGTLQKGWLADDGNWYALWPMMDYSEKDGGGMMSYPGWVYDYDTKEFADVPHYWVNPDGSVATGWASMMNYYIDRDNNKVPVREFVFADPTNGELVTGWNQIDGKWYYFGNPNDPDAKGNFLNYAHGDNGGWLKVDGVDYRVDKSGAQVLGWNRTLNDGVSNWYYANPANAGALAKDEFVQIDGKWYYFDENEILEDNGQFEYNGDTYYAGKDGALVSGWVQDAADKPWYHYADNGVMDTGWIEDGGNWYYLNEDGTMAQNEWVDDYYVGSDGAWVEWTPED